MPTYIKFIFGIILLGLLTFLVISNRNSATMPQSVIPTTTVTPIVDFAASFEIYTNGTRRIFTDKKYHNQSADIYIQNPDPSIIYVKKSGLTWNDFFLTLPMKLTAGCLTTGTGQIFCSGDDGKLSFYINDREEPRALEMTIKPNDRLVVIYK